MKKITAVLLSCTAAITLPSFAVGSVALKSVVEKEVQFTNDKGEKVSKRVEAKKAQPGEVLIYTITYTNNGKDAASKVEIANPIPEHMAYVGRSATGEGAVISYSVDGGKIFAAAEALRVRTADGGERPAMAADYSHIRWILSQAVRPGAHGAVSFQAKLK